MQKVQKTLTVFTYTLESGEQIRTTKKPTDFLTSRLGKVKIKEETNQYVMNLRDFVEKSDTVPKPITGNINRWVEFKTFHIDETIIDLLKDENIHDCENAEYIETMKRLYTMTADDFLKNATKVIKEREE